MFAVLMEKCFAFIVNSDESMSGEPPVLTASGTADAASEDEGAKNCVKDAKQPRWRKKYLPAGLFSDYFKLDE